MNPFEGYVETLMTVEPSTYTLEAGAGFNGEDLFTINGLVSDYLDDMCGWMGFRTLGRPTQSLRSHNRMVLSAMRQGYDCTNDGMGGYWTLTFERSWSIQQLVQLRAAPIQRPTIMTPRPQWTMAPVCTSSRRVSSLAIPSGKGMRRGCIGLHAMALPRHRGLWRMGAAHAGIDR